MVAERGFGVAVRLAGDGPRQRDANYRSFRGLLTVSRKQENPFESPDWKAYERSVRDQLIPMVEGAAVTLAVIPGGNEVDVKMATELGFMVMMDKPILAIVEPGTEPPHARRWPVLLGGLPTGRVPRAQVLVDEALRAAGNRAMPPNLP